MAAPCYRWLIQGFTLCGHEKELHKFTLFKSVHTSITYDDCVQDYNEYMKTNSFKFKTLCLPPKILVCAPIVGDLTEFVHDTLASVVCFPEEKFEEAGFDEVDCDTSDTYSEPVITWDLYMRSNCGCNGHYTPYAQSHILFKSLQSCIYNFAQYFLQTCNTDITSWSVFIHATK